MIAGTPDDIQQALVVADWIVRDRLMYRPRFLAIGLHGDWTGTDWVQAAEVELECRLGPPGDGARVCRTRSAAVSLREENILWGFPVALCFAIAHGHIDMTVVYEQAETAVLATLKRLGVRLEGLNRG